MIDINKLKQQVSEWRRQYSNDEIPGKKIYRGIQSEMATLLDKIYTTPSPAPYAVVEAFKEEIDALKQKYQERGIAPLLDREKYKKKAAKTLNKLTLKALKPHQSSENAKKTEFISDMILFLNQLKNNFTLYKESIDTFAEHKQRRMIGFYQAWSSQLSGNEFNPLSYDIALLVENPNAAMEQIEKVLEAFDKYLKENSCGKLSQYYTELLLKLETLKTKHNTKANLAQWSDASKSAINLEDKTLPPTEASYPARTGNTFKPYIDAYDDEDFSQGCFIDMMKAIHDANHFVLISGWKLELQQDYETPFANKQKQITLGEKLIKKAIDNPGCEIVISLWAQHPTAKSAQKHRHGEEYLQECAKKMGINYDDLPNIRWRRTNPSGALLTYHHKMLLTEKQAFLGGLDLAPDRMDCHNHALSLGNDNTPKKYLTALAEHGLFFSEKPTPNTAELLKDKNAEIRYGWHDVHMQVTGPVVADCVDFYLSTLAVQDPDTVTHFANKHPQLHPRFLVDMHLADTKLQEDNEAAALGPNFSCEFLRSSKKDNSNEWHLAENAERSIQHAYLEMINKAEDFIYIENQYFTGGKAIGTDTPLKNDVPEALVSKIIEKSNANQAFHVHIVLPLLPNRLPEAHDVDAIRYYQHLTLRWVMKAIEEKTGKAWHEYLSIFTIVDWQGKQDKKTEINDYADQQRHNRSGHINLHTKLIMVDWKDCLIGSANINERSLAGSRDVDDAIRLQATPGYEQACETQLKNFHLELIEHLFGQAIKSQINASSDLASPDFIHTVNTHAQTQLEAFYKNENPRHPKDGYIIRWPYSKAKNHTGEFELAYATLPNTPYDKLNHPSYTFAPLEAPTELLLAETMNVKIYK